MTRALRFLPLALALACTNNGSSDDGADTDVEDPNAGLDIDAVGDFSCFTPAATFEATTWAPEQVAIANPGDVTVDGTVEDFEKAEPRSSRTVALWYNDAVSGEPDVSAEVGSAAGDVSIVSPACKPVTYRTQELPGLGEAKVTYKAHAVFGKGEGGHIAATFQSVSNTTYTLIPTIVSIDIDPTKGSIAGSAYDCSRDPDMLPDNNTGKIQGARMRIFDADGNPPEGATIKYFVDDFPDRNQPYTSADGLWGAFNVPPGEWTIELYAKVGGEVVVLGRTQASVYPDTINIANVWSGHPDGVKLPATCVDGGGGEDTDVPADTDVPPVIVQ
jgi:hypothetical protein